MDPSTGRTRKVSGWWGLGPVRESRLLSIYCWLGCYTRHTLVRFTDQHTGSSHRSCTYVYGRGVDGSHSHSTSWSRKHRQLPHSDTHRSRRLAVAAGVGSFQTLTMWIGLFPWQVAFDFDRLICFSEQYLDATRRCDRWPCLCDRSVLKWVLRGSYCIFPGRLSSPSSISVSGLSFLRHGSESSQSILCFGPTTAEGHFTAGMAR